MAHRNLFAHLQTILSTAALLLIFVVKAETVLGTPHTAQLKTSQLPAKVFHFLCYDSLKTLKLKQPKSNWSLLLQVLLRLRRAAEEEWGEWPKADGVCQH